MGVAESDVMGNVPGKSSLQHHAEAAYNALEDAGLQMSDIDGVLTAGFSTLATAEYFGIEPLFTDSTSVGGSSFIIHVAHAIAAIRAGYCETALITHGQAGRSARLRVPADGNLPAAMYEAPLRHYWRPHQLLHGLHSVHARIRRGQDPAGNGGDRRGDAQVGQPESRLPRCTTRP